MKSCTKNWCKGIYSTGKCVLTKKEIKAFGLNITAKRTICVNCCNEYGECNMVLVKGDRQAEPRATKEELKDERLREVLEDYRKGYYFGENKPDPLSAIKQEYEMEREEILKILDSQYGITLREGTDITDGVIKALADNVADALVGKVKAGEKCPRCRGNGKVRGSAGFLFTCLQCNGTGKSESEVER